MSILKIDDTIFQKDMEEILLLAKDWKFDKYKTLLTSVLRPGEPSVLISLIMALREDGCTIDNTGNQLTILGTGGWKNKVQIKRRIGLPSRRVYAKGFFDRLVNYTLIEIRLGHHGSYDRILFRANIHHPLVKSMFAALLREYGAYRKIEHEFFTMEGHKDIGIKRIEDITLLKATRNPTTIIDFEWESEIFPIMEPYSQVRQLVLGLLEEYIEKFGEPDNASMREDPLSIVVKLWNILYACISAIHLPPTLESRMFFVGEVPTESIQFATEAVDALIQHKTHIESLIEKDLPEVMENLIETLENVLELSLPLAEMKVISASKLEVMLKYMKVKEELDSLVMDLSVEYNRFLQKGNEPVGMLEYHGNKLFYFQFKLGYMLRRALGQVRANQTDPSDGADYFRIMHKNFEMIDELDSIILDLLEIGPVTILHDYASTTQDESSHSKRLLKRSRELISDIILTPKWSLRDGLP